MGKEFSGFRGKIILGNETRKTIRLSIQLIIIYHSKDTDKKIEVEIQLTI